MPPTVVPELSTGIIGCRSRLPRWGRKLRDLRYKQMNEALPPRTRTVIGNFSRGASGSDRAPGFAMPLVLKLAIRNLLQDRLRFIATVIGIVFSIVLVTIQMGLFLGFERTVTTMIDHASADLWIVSKGTKCFEDPSHLDARDRDRVLSVPGVTAAVPGVGGWGRDVGGLSPKAKVLDGGP